MKPSLAALALQEKAAHAVAGQPDEVVFAPSPRVDGELHEALAVARQLAAQSEQPLTLPAKGVKPNAQGASVRPEDFIALKGNFLVQPVPGRIAPEEDVQNS
jgi:hypothetical protein